jgi:hypothetical protein
VLAPREHDGVLLWRCSRAGRCADR